MFILIVEVVIEVRLVSLCKGRGAKHSDLCGGVSEVGVISEPRSSLVLSFVGFLKDIDKCLILQSICSLLANLLDVFPLFA